MDQTRSLPPRPVVLCVLDGWGHSPNSADNAIAAAATPAYDRFIAEYPNALLHTSGIEVGLPGGQMGNSEVGHLNLGAGRIVDQEIRRIDAAIEDGSLARNEALRGLINALSRSGGTCHLMGLLSPGGVHSHQDHIAALAHRLDDAGVPVAIHAFLDGRDMPPASAADCLTAFRTKIVGLRGVRIATICGRYYAMDRDNRWERVAPAYRLVTDGAADHIFEHPGEALMAAYERGETDEFVAASAIRPDGRCIRMTDGDAVVYMNFRADRARQLSRAFLESDFHGFQRDRLPKLLHFVSLTAYAADIPSEIAFTSEIVNNSLGEYIASLGMQQLRLAETEKYAHVTFFFSGGRELEFSGEDRLLIPSPDIATYDLQPEMSAPAVTDALINAISSRRYSLIVCNYANGDMVGHSGNFDAAVKAVECVDTCLGRVIGALESVDGQCLITADHGNVEQMSDPDSAQPHTAHTALNVPLVYIGPRQLRFQSDGGVLSDVAPTVIELMALKLPTEMTGRSLVCQPKVSKVTA